MPRFLQFDANVATGQIIGAAFAQASIPRGRLMIDVTARPEAVLGCAFTATPPLVPDWTFQGDPLQAPLVPARTWVARVEDTFDAPVVVQAARSKIPKTAFLAVLQPDEYAAWRSSQDAALVYGLGIFEADQSVDLNTPLIPQVLARAVQLTLITPQRSVAIQSALTAMRTP
jgi:hypothetical protein